MRTTLLTAFLALIALSGTALAQQDSACTLRVLTFNILHGATTAGDFDLDKIAAVINDLHPDLVALQEVDYMTHRAKKYDLAGELGTRTRLIPLFGRAMYYDGGEYGEAILSKHTFLSSRKVALPHSPGNEPRAALEVVTALSGCDTIAFIGTHLDHTADETDRIAQAKAINEAFAFNAWPSILAGDLNALPGSNAIGILKKNWTPAHNMDNTGHTYPSGGPVKKIDYIMFRPAHRWRVLDTNVICDTIASDHCAYLVILELLP